MRVCTMGTLWDADDAMLAKSNLTYRHCTESRERFQTRSIFTKSCKEL